MAAPTSALLLSVALVAAASGPADGRPVEAGPTPAPVAASRAEARLTLGVPALAPEPAARAALRLDALDEGGGARGVESPWIAALMSGVIGFGSGHAMVGARPDALVWLGVDAGATLTGILVGVIADHGVVWGVVAVALIGGRVVEAVDAFGKGEHVDPGDPLSRRPLVGEDGRPRSSVGDGDRRVHDLDDERSRREADAAEEEAPKPSKRPKPPVEEDEETKDEDDQRLEEGALPGLPAHRPA